MAHVVVAQPIAPEGVSLLEQAGHDVTLLSAHSPEALGAALRGADALLVRDAHVTRAVVEAADRLQVIARHGAGLDRIDLAAASDRGIVVTYTPVANSRSVAEHAMALILALAKHLVVVDRATRAGRFDIRHDRYGMELADRRLGILGFGNVGRRLAQIAAHGFGMRVLACDPLAPKGEGVEWVDRWQTLLAESDVVSLHLPNTPQTRGLIDLAALRLMKRDALLVNCARGEVVKEDDLVQALREGLIAGAGVDVYDPDPPAGDHPLFALDNVVVTPHTAAHTLDAMRNMAVQAAQGIVDVLGGRAPQWPANDVAHRSSRTETGR